VKIDPEDVMQDLEAAIDSLEEAVDSLAKTHSDSNRCEICPLPLESVCFPYCAAWLTARKALNTLVVRAAAR